MLFHPSPIDSISNFQVDEEIPTPDHKDVYKFVRTLFTQAQLASEVVMVTLIYLERLLTYAEFDFGSTNWKRLTLGSIMLASKDYFNDLLIISFRISVFIMILTSPLLEG